jgi:hypothetical protein
MTKHDAIKTKNKIFDNRVGNLHKAPLYTLLFLPLHSPVTPLVGSVGLHYCSQLYRVTLF